MQYVIALLFLVVGYFVGAFGIIQILVVSRFSIPYTKELNASGVLNDSHIIIKSNVQTIIIWIGITVGITILIYNFASQLSFIAFLTGILVDLMFGFGETGKTQTNINEYFGNYRNFFTPEFIEYLQNKENEQ